MRFQSSGRALSRVGGGGEGGNRTEQQNILIDQIAVGHRKVITAHALILLSSDL
jgi:hypothetical protein